MVDYGATIIILLHQLEGTAFYTLYGHVSVAIFPSVITEGNYISLGQEFAHLANLKKTATGHHTHLQVIANMELKKRRLPWCAGLAKKKNIRQLPRPRFYPLI